MKRCALILLLWVAVGCGAPIEPLAQIKPPPTMPPTTYFGPVYNAANFGLSLPESTNCSGIAPSTGYCGKVWAGCVPMKNNPTPTQRYRVRVDYTVCQTNGSSPEGAGVTSGCNAGIPGMQGVANQVDIPADLANGQSTAEGPHFGACETGVQFWTGVPNVDCGNGQTGIGFGLIAICTQPAYVPGGNNVSVAVEATPIQ